jgi:putative NADH-flavin reductase
MPAYAVLGATGNTGTALIQILLQSPDNQVHAFCRSKAKLSRLLPEAVTSTQLHIFESTIDDVPTLASCIRSTLAVFLVTSTNDNVPGFRVGQDLAANVLLALRENLKLQTLTSATASALPTPKLILLSSATIDPVLSRNTPYLLHRILLWSASNVYADLRETEALLRKEEAWVKTVFIKPGALAVDVQRGHALSLTDESSPLSYLDLAAGMIEAADDEGGKYDMQNVGVINVNGRARFPKGTLLCILTGLIRHFFPGLHTWLPSNTGPA